MSLKIKNNITSIKLNNNYIQKAKINGNIIYELKGQVNITIIYSNNEFTVTSDKDGTYILYYANENGILSDYEKICSLSLKAKISQKYIYFNDLNVAPLDATKIVACDIDNNIVSRTNMPSNLSLSLGNKLYTVGLLSDIHIDGNGDGNNNDSGSSQSDFINALQYFNGKNVDFICIDGDITYYGYDADYEAYNSIVNTYSNNIPIKAIRGNHECYVNGSDNYDYTNTNFETNVGNLYYEYVLTSGDVYLFCGMYKEDSSSPFSDDELVWLSNKLEEHKNNRVFLFVHYYLGETGNVNHIVSIHSPISNQTFIDLITKYKNVVYFSGHTHLAFYTQQYGKYNNIKSTGNICHRVHIPSCAKPRTSSDGIEGSAQVYAEGSEGYLMEAYENGILLKGINFETNKFIPIATYYLDTTINIEETPSTMAAEWLDYNVPNFDGASRAYNQLDTWLYNYDGGQINGVYLSLDINIPSTFYMTTGYYAYAGAPTNYSVFILDSNNNDAIINRYDYEFDSNGSYTKRQLTINFEPGDYKVVIGSDEAFEMGIAMLSISLT